MTPIPRQGTKWEIRFLKLAIEIGHWSKDPSSKVGTVIVDPMKRIVSTGYNGFPRGMTDRPEYLQNRDMKLALTIHSELNALLTSELRDHDLNTLYCSHFSCSRCTAALIQAGIRKFVYPIQDAGFYERWKEDIKISYLLMKESGAEAHIIDLDPPA